MKVLVVFSALICLVISEAPYPASGWKPSGALLVLPSRQQQQQHQHPLSGSESQFARQQQHQYPLSGSESHFARQQQNQYHLSGLESQFARQQQLPSAYGPPQPNFPPQDLGADGSGSNGDAPANGVQTGSYYVLLPDGKLQRIQYSAAPAASGEGKTTGAQGISQQSTFGQQFQSTNFNNRNFQQAQDNFSQKQTSLNENTFRSGRVGEKQDNLSFGQATNNVNTFQRANNQQNANTSGQKVLQTPSVVSSQTNNQQANDNSAAPPRLVAQFSEAQLKAGGPFPDGYVASVQFSDVPPITAPVYVFNPAPLVRVLRMTP